MNRINYKLLLTFAFVLLAICWIPLGFVTGYVMHSSSLFGYEECLDKVYYSLFFMLVSLLSSVIMIIIVVLRKSIKNVKRVLLVFVSVVAVFSVAFSVLLETNYKSVESETYGISKGEEKSYFSFVDKVPPERKNDYVCIYWKEHLFDTNYIRIKSELFYNADNYDSAVYDVGYLSSDNKIIFGIFSYIHSLNMKKTETATVNNKRITVLNNSNKTKFIIADKNNYFVFQTDKSNNALDNFNNEVFYNECFRLYDLLCV